ncbi:uncharacterized protein E5676_scaffold322G00420 [Cucumis melo var. makuwa]|uniref:Gag-pol polyprotein n=1 Tax=Cucumis melo var. makuwa TaxID=1194695 RepID=A0A5A7TCY4_CUCMM|nr:uncharacterized protein E6C27_scaffold121G00320 [Cucumis melo var. makuwa]TYK26973.1 uncharacterized protein E5676_scaffold322G00420 [Cucumis melo var. makuwa]
MNKRRENEKGDRSFGSSKGERSSRCHEHEGFGHFQVECPTFLKHKKKRLSVTLSDDETSSDSGSEEFRKALISCVAKDKQNNDTSPHTRENILKCADNKESSQLTT